jgi:hypothetical protein
VHPADAGLADFRERCLQLLAVAGSKRREKLLGDAFLLRQGKEQHSLDITGTGVVCQSDLCQRRGQDYGDSIAATDAIRQAEILTSSVGLSFPASPGAADRGR